MPKKKKIDEIPVEQVEEVVNIQEKKEEEKREYTDEEKKKLDEFYYAMIKKQLKPRVAEVSHYMDLTNKKLDTVYADIAAKKCGLSTLNRNFLTSFERDFINELFAKRYL